MGFRERPLSDLPVSSAMICSTLYGRLLISCLVLHSVSRCHLQHTTRDIRCLILLAHYRQPYYVSPIPCNSNRRTFEGYSMNKRLVIKLLITIHNDPVPVQVASCSTRVLEVDNHLQAPHILVSTTPLIEHVIISYHHYSRVRASQTIFCNWLLDSNHIPRQG